MTGKPPPWIVLAHLLRPQGRKGELLAELFTDFPERFENRKQVYLAPSGFEGEASQARSAEVVSFWLPVGKNEGRIVLQFAGVDSISQAEGLAGLEVLVQREDRMPLSEDSVYTSDLIGCTVYDGSVEVGKIVDSLIPSAENYHPLDCRQFLRDSLRKRPPLRRQEDDRLLRSVAFRFGRNPQRSDCIIDRFRLQNHPFAAAKWTVIHSSVAIMSEGAKVVRDHLDQPRCAGAL